MFRDFFEDSFPFRGNGRPSSQDMALTTPESRVGFWTPFTGATAPRIRMDVTETADSYDVTAELPGISKDDVKVSVDRNVLYIEAEKKQEERKDTDKSHMVERRYGKFQRSIVLPENADAENPKASYNDGVLKLFFPKKEGTSRKQISF